MILFLQSLKSFFKEFSCIPVSKVKDGTGNSYCIIDKKFSRIHSFMCFECELHAVQLSVCIICNWA